MKKKYINNYTGNIFLVGRRKECQMNYEKQKTETYRKLGRALRTNQRDLQPDLLDN